MVTENDNDVSDVVKEKLMNTISAQLGTFTPVIGAEGRLHQHPIFWSARRDEAKGAYRLVVETYYAAGPAEGKMTLSCWVHDDESEKFGAGSGVYRVSDLREDPTLEHA